MLQEFNPLFLYNSCFPPSKITQEWFSYPSFGHSVRIDIPPNLYNDNTWMGLTLCVCFSFHGDPKTILDNLVSEIPHFLYCQFRTIVGRMDNDQVIGCVTSKVEIMWLNNVGGFIWISYIPRELLKNMLHQCSFISASFVSDWPGVMVRECALRLLYQNDRVQFEQKLKQCNALISEHSDSASQFMVDQEKRNKRPKQNRPLIPMNCIEVSINSAKILLLILPLSLSTLTH
jgi:hypothetical protein